VLRSLLSRFCDCDPGVTLPRKIDMRWMGTFSLVRRFALVQEHPKRLGSSPTEAKMGCQFPRLCLFSHTPNTGGECLKIIRILNKMKGIRSLSPFGDAYFSILQTPCLE
jgi:hypothetical protein